jgi:hypothetical protein
MRTLTAVFSVLAATAGWFYMFYSRAAHKLEGIEAQTINARRVRLRRIGGFAMFLLAVLTFAGVWTVDAHGAPMAFVAIWLSVIALLLFVVVLALIDLRLTSKLRRASSTKSS